MASQQSVAVIQALPEGLHTSTEPARDIRQAGTERKRDKDHTTKWSRGWRELPGVVAGQNQQQVGTTKLRPAKKASSSHAARSKPHPNTLKCKTYFNAPQSSLSKLLANYEIRASTSAAELDSAEWPKATRSQATPFWSTHDSADDPFLYSYDRNDTPGRPLSLAMFVRGPSDQQTEKLVKKEYEVVDADGENTLSGRAATRMLRAGPLWLEQRKNKENEVESFIEDEGFQLL